jgi:hypothetical protein
LPAVGSFRFIESRRRLPTKDRKLESFRLTSLSVLLPLLVSLITFRASYTGLRIPVPESKWLNFATQNNCGDGTENWESDCLFGSSTPRFTAALIGDSNARSASDGVFDAVQSLGGALFISVKSGCSMIDNPVEPDCQKLNLERFEKIRTLKPDLVILVSNYTAYLGNFSEDQILRGLERTIEFMATNEIPAVVQGQIPDCHFSLSLIKAVTNKIYGCEIGLADQLGRSRLLKSSQMITLRSDKNVFIDPTNELCPKLVCRSHRNDSWIYSDGNHLSPTGSKMLTPLYVEAIKQVLEQP